MRRGRQPNTQRARVLEVLAEGPTTSTEVAVATELSLKHASAYLIQLKIEGLVTVTGTMKPEPCPGCGHRGKPRFLYSLVRQVA